MGGPDEIPNKPAEGIPRRRVLKGLAAGAATLGAMAASPLFTRLALARDCEGKRCGDWKMEKTPRDPAEEKRWRDSLREMVPEGERVNDIQGLFERILAEHKVRLGRYFIEMEMRSVGITFDIFEGRGTGRKSIGGFSIGGIALQSDLGRQPQQIPMSELINLRAFQMHFREQLTQSFRLTEDAR